MQIEVKNLPKSEILITVEVPQELLEKYEEEASKRVSERIEIPGFRKGQAPKAFVIAQIGPDAFFQETLNVALPRSYFEAVKLKNVAVISRPDVKVLSKAPLKYEARVALMPEVTLKGFEKIAISQTPITVSDKEIDEVVEEMRRYRATYKPHTREIQKGDRIEIDFQGFDDGGAPLDKTKSANHALFVGERSLVEGFEDQLLGMKAGEKKKFPIKFPKDFQYEPLRAKTVHFETEVKKTEETILPELTEDFVGQVMGEKKSVPEFREALKVDLHRRKGAEDRQSRENALLEKFLKEAKLEVPPLLIDEEVDYMIADLQRELEGRGLKFETYVEKFKKEKRDLKKEYEPEAEKRIRIRLILNYLFRELKIEVTPEELGQAAQVLESRTPEADRSKLKEQFEKHGEVYLRLKNNLMLEKLFTRYLGPIA